MTPEQDPPLLAVAPGYRHVLRAQMAVPALVLSLGAVIADQALLRDSAIHNVPSIVVPFLALLATIVIPQRKFRRLRYRLTDRMLHSVRGWIVHTDTLVPFVRVQHLDVRRGPLDKLFGTATLVVHTAGTHNSIVTVDGLAPDRAAEIRDVIREHVRIGLRVTATDQAVGTAERLHPLYLATGLGRGLRQMAGGYAVIGYLAATGSWRTALLLLAAFAVIMLGGIFLYWRRFEYRVGANEIRIDSGILSRTHRSIPFDRIQDVDISQGPVARLLGLARVKFETGGSAGAKDDDGALAAIALPRAEALRELVRARRMAAVDDVVPVEADEAAPLFAMDLRRVLLAGLFNFSLAVLAALFGATQTIGDVAGIDFFARRFWREALDAGSPIADLIMAHQIAAILAGTVLLVTLGIATGVGRTLLRDYRFRLDRTATGLRRRRGLLTLTDVTLPLARVQVAIVGSGPLRDHFGWRDLKLQSLAKDEGEKGDHLVAPLARDSEVAAILGQLDWRPVAEPVAWQRVSTAYAWGFTISSRCC